MSQNILKSSLELASLSIIFQILSRCITSVLNAFVVRRVGHVYLGIIHVRLLLLESMILFLSREPFRKACLTNASEHNWAQVINLLWMPVPISIVISFLLGYIWLSLPSTSETLPAYYTFAVVAIAVSCIIEMLSLSIELVASVFLFVRFKIILDAIIIAFRTLIFVLLILQQPENTLFAFGVGQLFAAIFYVIGHYVYFYYHIRQLNSGKLKRQMSLKSQDNKEFISREFPFRRITSFLPGQLENHDTCLNKNLTILTWSFYKQGILKQILTEGERLILTFVPIMTLIEQGTYEIVNNLGSLTARFIFHPIEDSSYFYFTQLINRDKSISQQDPVKIKESVNVLEHLCSIVTSIGLIILVFGQSYSSLLLWLYGGEKLTTSLPISLMRAHCLAVLLLGVNGVTECYTNATADDKIINKNNVRMIYESIIFLGVSYLFAIWFGSIGFIFGNCINMTLRIIRSTSFINQRHNNTIYRPLRGLIPKPIFSASLVIAALVTNVSYVYFFPERKLLHFFIGVMMGLPVVISWMYEHHELIKLITNKWYERRNEKKKTE